MADAIDVGVRRRHGKTLDYGQLGKRFPEGEAFMRHMGEAAQRLSDRALAAGVMERVAECPICRSSRHVETLRCRGFAYRQCANVACGHVFVANRLPESWREEFFRSDPEYSRANYCDPRRTQYRIEQIATPKVEHVLEHCDAAGGVWLDVGCGSGEVLAALRGRAGWDGIGLELSSADAAFGREHLRVEIHERTLTCFAREQSNLRPDVISLFGVLHCVAQPTALLREAAALLGAGGLLVAEVTNFESLTALAVRSFPEHPTRSSFHGVTTLHQFTQRSIVRALEGAGLTACSVWFYGADVYEVLNQWCFSDPAVADSPLMSELSALAGRWQESIDASERSSNMLWIARRAG